MKTTFLLFVTTLLTTFSVHARTNMNLEGSCVGQLHDKKTVAFTYYSDFDGCKATSKAGITFTRSTSSVGQGLSTGERSFTDAKEIYTFKDKKLTFANMTGNEYGSFTYKDQNRRTRTIKVTCQIRNYEYAPCE